MVVCTHAETLNKRLVMPWVHWGISGVDLFFVISGFVMVYTTAGRPVAPARFLLNRIVRIVPLYWVFTLAVFALALAAPMLLQSTTANWLDLIRSLFFLPFQKGGGLTQPVLFLGWTLNYEMFFYALFALSLWVRPLGLRTGLMVLLLGLLAAAGQIFHPRGTISAFYTNSIILEFAFGMALAYFNRKAVFSNWPPVVPALLLALAAGGAILAVHSPLAFHYRAFYWGVPAILVVWAAVMLEARGRRYSGDRLLLLGAASYSIYLAHPFAYIPIEKLATRAHLTTGTALPLMFAAAVAAMMATGVAVHLLLERPLTQAIRGVTRGPGAQGEARALWPWRLSAKPGDSRGDKAARDD